MKKLIICGLILYSSASYGKGDTLNCAITAGANISDGNLKNHSYNFAGDLRRIKGKMDWAINPTYKYLISYPYPITTTSTPSKQNEFYMSSHISHRFSQDWKIMLFSEIEHSQLRKENLRYNIGIGPSWKLINTHSISPKTKEERSVLFEISDVVMIDYYESMILYNTLPQRDNLSLRTSLRIKFLCKRGIATFSSIQLFQPSIVTWTKNTNEDIGWADNTNFRSINSLDFRIIGNLCVGVSLDYIYQSYLNYVAKDPAVKQTGIYLSPEDVSFCFYIKYKSK